MTRILISAGGTGGGVYPALAVARALRQQAPDATLDFASSVHGIENQLLDTASDVIDNWHRIQSGPLHGVNPLRRLTSAIRIAAGLFQSFALLLSVRPDVVFLTGGWVGVPVALAANVLRIPVIIFVPDIEPGRTLKLLGRFARTITATSQDTARYYAQGKHVVETGYPLRESLLDATRAEAFRHFGLDPQKRTLLVFGGSRGSRAINKAVLNHIDQLMAIPDLQILHVSGRLDASAVQQQRDALPETTRARYHTLAYVEDFGLALVVADLVVCRAGASTLGEFPVFGLPAILIPLAYTWHYQEINADWLASRGAAIRLDEPDMESQLVPLIRDLMADEARYESMRARSQALARRDGSANIAAVILSSVKTSHD